MTQPVNKRPSISPVKSQETHWFRNALLILIVAFIAFSPALKAGFIWDDQDMLTENHLINAPDGLGRIWAGEFVDYFPLTMSTLWIEWRIWGMNATGYHVTNILLHALTAVLLWRILVRLNIPGGFWAALIFAIHPVNVESVAWITERKNTLSLFFAAISTLAFVKAHVSSSRALDAKAQKRWWLVSLAAFALSLLAKTSTVMLPFVFLGILWFSERRRDESVARQLKFDVVRLVPFFAVAGGLALVTIWFQYNRAIEQTVVNESTLAERGIIAGQAVWFYLGKILFPAQLTFVYPRWQVDAGRFLSFLPALAAVATWPVLFMLRNKLGRGPFLAFGYFLLTLFPVLGFFNIYFQRYSFVADHWQYLSMIGIVVLVVAGISRLMKEKAQFLFIGVIAVLAWLTFDQAKIYHNQETLWRDTLRKNPGCAMAEANWGLFLANQGRRDEALPHYEAALKLNPRDDSTIFNWGVILLGKGQVAAAAEKFEQTLEVNPRNKSALMSLAWIRAIEKDPALRDGPAAVRLAELGVEVTKAHDEWMLDTLAAAYAEAGRFQDAISTENKAIEVAGRKGGNGLAEMKMRLQLYRAGKPFRMR